jgi:hypothetical protein
VEGIGPSDCSHTTSETGRGNNALGLSIILQVNTGVSLTRARLRSIRIGLEPECAAMIVYFVLFTVFAITVGWSLAITYERRGRPLWSFSPA